MTNITIKTADISVEVFNKEGTSLGVYTGQQGQSVMLYLENPVPEFLKIRNTAGEFHYINKDCTCKSVAKITQGSVTFDDMSEPMAECHPIAELKYASATDTVAVGASKTPALAIPPYLTVKYTSSDPTIATVDANGKITGVKAGEVTITAVTKDPTKPSTSSIEVTVTA